MIKAGGQLRHRIALQSITGYTKNAEGEKTPTWTTYATVWAEVAPSDGPDFTYEKVRNKAPESVVTHDVLIRYNSTVSPKHQFIFDGRTFTIVFVITDKERGIWQTIRAEEVVA